MEGGGGIPPYCTGNPIIIPGGGGGTPCGDIPGSGIPAAIPGGMPGGGIGGGGTPIGNLTTPYGCK